jgi:predicted lipoprotein with Yx(FWY)xxD motif
MKLTIPTLAAVGAGAAALVAGVGSPATVVPAAYGTPAASSAVGLRHTSHGATLVDARGRTLYLFEADRANKSNCSSACLTVWPLFTAKTKPHARGGAVASKIGTIPGPGGRRIVTYAKHPLYYYVGDRKPGDTRGQGLRQFGAKWYVLSASGRKIDDD